MIKKAVSRPERVNGSSISKVASAVMLSLAVSSSSFGFEFQLGDKWLGNFDSTFTYGISQRIEDVNPLLVGKSNNAPFLLGSGQTPEGAWSNNSDDGNLNFQDGIISNAFKAIHELDIRYEDHFGFFVRGRYYYDTEVKDEKRDFRELTKRAKEQHGADIEFLDAYMWASFDIGDSAAQIRIGEQVVNWGESTFIQHSISAANPLDAAKLRVPGAELREAFIPVQTLWGTIDLTDSLSLEAYAQFEWEQTRVDAPGTYFSTNDFIGVGGDTIWLGFSQLPDISVSERGGPASQQTGVDPAIGNLSYSINDVIAAAYAAEGVSDPSLTDLARSAFIIARTMELNSSIREADREASSDGQYGIRLGWFAEDLNDTEFGFYYINYHAKRPIISVRGHDGDNIRGFAEYLENITLYGVSFNTVVPSGWLTGLSIGGELSVREDEPLQIDDVELLFEASEAIGITAPGVSQVLPYTVDQGAEISGYRLFDTYQLQTTFTHLLGPRFGADQVVLLMEVGGTYIKDMPDKDELRFDAPGTARSGNPARAGRGIGFTVAPANAANVPCVTRSSNYVTGASTLVECEGVETNSFADDLSYGYRMVVRGEYNSVIGGWNAAPRLVFQHDVKGTTPLPIANFIEDRKSLALGVKLDYQSQWQVDLVYNRFFGAFTANALSDRDFIALSFGYSI